MQSRKDDASWDNTAKYTIGDASHYIEIDWQAASGAGANDGSLSLWIDGVLKETRSALDNDTHTIEQAKLGPLYGIDGGTSGTEYFDAFESRRQNYIGGRALGKAGLHKDVVDPAGERLKWGGRSARADGQRRGPSAPLLAPPTGQTWKMYYYAGAQRIAMRELVGATGNTLYYLLGDHLGSTSITVCGNSGGCGTKQLGEAVAELRYKAWGEQRYPTGTSNTPTTYRYTGQRQESGLGGADGLYFYNARWYDPAVGRFLQADTIVPEAGNPQAFNRYSYVLNSPLNYTDPSGHYACGDGEDQDECGAGGSAAGGSVVPILTPEQYIDVGAYADSTMGTHAPEAIRRMVWVYRNSIGRYYRDDPFTYFENANAGQPPPWWQIIAYFAYGSWTLYEQVGGMTPTQRRYWLWYAYNYYTKHPDEGWKIVVATVKEVITASPDQDPTGGAEMYSHIHASSWGFADAAAMANALNTYPDHPDTIAYPYPSPPHPDHPGYWDLLLVTSRYGCSQLLWRDTAAVCYPSLNLIVPGR